MDANVYFESSSNYFWQWEESGNVICIPGSNTIAYKGFIFELIEKLSPQGLPPFGSLLLALIATNPASEESLEYINIIIKRSLKTNDENLVNDVFYFLKLLSVIPEEFRDGKKRLLLFQAIFHNCHNRVSKDFSLNILKKISENTNYNQNVSPSDKINELVFYRDFRTLKLLSNKFQTVNDILDKIASVPKVQDELLEIELKAPSNDEKMDFFSELLDNSKTYQIGSLIKRLWAGLNISANSALPSAQPLGGVSDLTTKGDLDKLLISEYANEDLLFLLRLANNEALFIQREVPPISDDFKRIILIDISLKNWGTPKTVAFAIMLAIAKHPKSTIDSSAYVVGNSYKPISIDSISGIIEGMQQLETCLHFSNGLKSFFKENPVKKNREVFILSASSTLKQSEMLKTIYEYHAFVNYWIFNDDIGNIDIYKRQQNSKKKIQHIQLPLEELWKKSHAPNGSKEIKRDVNCNSPLLYRGSVTKKKILNTSDGEIFQLTADKRLYKLHDKNVLLHQKGWELVRTDLPKGIHESEIGLLNNGEYILLIFSIQDREVVLINISTGIVKSFIFTNWKSKQASRFIFFNDKFHYKNSFEQFSIDQEGLVALDNEAVPELFDAREKELSLITQKNSYAQTPFKNIHSVAINERNALVFNVHELKLNKDSHLKLETSIGLVKTLEAKQIKEKEFEFNDGSKIEIDRTGLILLCSSDNSIPVIYIPSYLDSSLGVATDDFFAGNEYYYEESQYEVVLKDPGIQVLNIVRLIKEHTGIGLKDAKELVDNSPKSLLLNCMESKSYTIKTILENNGAKVELIPLPMKNGKSSKLTKITTSKFYNEYIVKFINHIVLHGNTN